MCTDITNSKSLRISSHPIVCYKVLILTDDNKLITPFKGCEIEFNKLIKAKGCKEHTPLLGSGFIHSFVNIVGVYSLVDYLGSIRCKVVKCYIPPFTRYYKGVDEITGYPAYASKRIIYKDIIKSLI